jgi:3-dehydroquinate synthase
MDNSRHEAESIPSVHGFSVSYQFPVSFTRGVWARGNDSFAQLTSSRERHRRHRVMVVIDERVADARPSLIGEIDEYFACRPNHLSLVSRPVVVPGGEGVKNDLAYCSNILEKINEAGLDRQSFITVIGGGAVLDMVSFAAAIAHRGIRVIRMPTTVLAQADSGIAVKNSMNLFGKKNFIGTFVPPFGVINDFDFLDTLNRRERTAGLSEAVKVSLLRDPKLFSYMEVNARRLAAGERQILAHVVQRSAELHLAHICGNGDPFELGSARPLDFGHWVAHKLESMTAHRVKHGEAVAIGMAVDLTYAVLMGHLDPYVCDRVLRLLEAIGLPLWDDAVMERDGLGRYTILAGLQEFREHLGGELHITLLRDIGRSFEVTTMDDVRVTEAIETLADRPLRNRHASAARVAAQAAQLQPERLDGVPWATL